MNNQTPSPTGQRPWPKRWMALPAIATAVLVMTATLLMTATAAGAQTAESTAEQERELAERYAPRLVLAPQAEACDPDGESFAPMSVDLVLDNPDVLLRQAGEADPVVERAPSATSLYGRGEGFYLDFPGLALEPACVYETDYRADNNGQAPVAYAHITTQADAPGKLVIQYWLYWYYNDWNNKHESDWEFIQVMFDASSVDEALGEEPVSVGYAQHEGGERSAWTDGQLMTDGTHPIVYPSRGSHASYFKPAVYLGRSGTQGFGCDTTALNTNQLNPTVDVLPTEATSAEDEFAWLGFTGRWGERGEGAFNGPTGPNTKDQWDRPVDWHNNLRPSSVEIPGGTETNSTMLSTFCRLVEIGSDQLRAFQVSPNRFIGMAIVGFFLLRLLARQTEWTASSPTPLRKRRRTGQILRASVLSFFSSGGALLFITSWYVPLALIVAAVGRFWSFSAAQTTAGLLTTVMTGFVTASVSAFWHLESKPDRPGIKTSVALVRHRAVPIVTTALRASAIVLALGVTIIGIPFAIRQLVRYQFVVPISTTENLSGRAALRRSTELVHGRWWHTAGPLALLTGAGILANSVVQLVLLVALGGFPLWAYLAISFLATGLIVPMIATAPVLLYGDAAAHDAAEKTETPDPGDARPSVATP